MVWLEYKKKNIITLNNKILLTMSKQIINIFSFVSIKRLNHFPPNHLYTNFQFLFHTFSQQLDDVVSRSGLTLHEIS